MTAPPTAVVRDALALWIALTRLFASVNVDKFPRRVLEVHLTGFGITCGVRRSLLPRSFCCGRDIHIERRDERRKQKNVTCVGHGENTLDFQLLLAVYNTPCMLDFDYAILRPVTNVRHDLQNATVPVVADVVAVVFVVDGVLLAILSGVRAMALVQRSQ